MDWKDLYLKCKHQGGKVREDEVEARLVPNHMRTLLQVRLLGESDEDWTTVLTVKEEL